MAFADYDITAYGQMLVHRARIDAYVSAIRAAVRPGDVVMDLGTGTGFMALIACQCGAGRVYAVEPSEGIALAEQAARDNGCAERITFLRARSSQVTLPEKCDVLISDLRGATPCFSTHLSDLMDVRARLLKPGARWICQTDTLFVSVTDLPREQDRIFHQWDGARWNLDLSSALPLASQQPVRRRAEPHELLGEPQAWARIAYPALASPHVRGTTRQRIARAGTAHGLVIWFDVELFGGARYSNAPGQASGPYSPVFFPWPRALDLQPADEVEIGLDAVASGHDYWWRWTARVVRTGATEPAATFNQSTFHAQTIARADIAASAPQHPPTLSPAGEEARFLLARMDGKTSQAALAAALRAQFPDRFRDEDAAFARVSEIRRAFGGR
ncbi:MAG: ribosomal protein methyltransferase [Verrucomicrobiota bacterium]|jgi:protein arginine N-methyltransferase 1